MDIDDLGNFFDDFQKEDSLSFAELFTENFMERHTRGKYKTYEEFFKNGGFNIEVQEEFDAISDEELDEYIKNTTDFKNWQDMIDEAGNDAIQKRLDTKE